MKKVYYPHNSKKLDQYMIEEKGIPGLLLMEQAATGVADAVCRLASSGKKVLCICGGGNNGGDGYAVARILLGRGYDVFCARVGEQGLPPDAQRNFDIVNGIPGRVALVDDTSAAEFFRMHTDAAVIVDALFGIGLSRDPAGIYAQIIEMMNELGAKIVSVDIPSGVFASTGAYKNAVRADVTVVMHTLKPGVLLMPGAALCGEVVIRPIGIDDSNLRPDAFWIDECRLPVRERNSHKGTYGHLGMIAGSAGMAGAAFMTARSAIAMGAGRTSVFTCEEVSQSLQSSLPAAMTVKCGKDHLNEDCAADMLVFAQKCSALVIGPGLSQRGGLRGIIRDILAMDIPKVLDADGLNQIMASDLDGAKKTIITPHPGEFARLLGMSVKEVLADPIKAAKDFALAHGVCVLLKGASTVVTDGITVMIVTSGCAGMAKGGSGDVLSGAIGALMAQGAGEFGAGYQAAFFCGKAGEAAQNEKGEYAMTPLDTIDHFCEVL